MHEEYYGFSEKPFNLTSDPKYLYKSHSHAHAFELLQYAIRRREGFVAVTGDIGTGKTTLCRAVLRQVDRKTFTALVLNPFLSFEDLLRLVLHDFGVISRDEVTRRRIATLSKQELIDTLNQFLLSLLPLGAGALLIIDEAHNLSAEVLEQIRILSNLETDQQKLLQIVLVGQLNLQEMLRSPELRQLDQRISIRCELKPLTRDETAAYVPHRLSVAGSSAVSFEPQALELVHKHTGGVPRLINLVCDRALLGGYAARTGRITPEIVGTAVTGLQLKAPRWWQGGAARRRAGAFAAGAAAMALVLGALYIGARVQNGRASADTLSTEAAAPVARESEPSPAASQARPAPATPGDSAAAGQHDPVAPTRTQDARAVQPGGSPVGQYSVLVASFRQADEADRLAGELRDQGHQVRTRRIQSEARGVWHQVLAGPYATSVEGRQAEARIRQIPGYADAQLIAR